MLSPSPLPPGGVSPVCEYPEVLPFEHTAELHLDAYGYDMVGPILFCSCYRQTNYGTLLHRRCLVTRRGALLLLRPEGETQPSGGMHSSPSGSDADLLRSIPNISHIVEFGSGGFAVNFYTQTISGADGKIKEHEVHFRIAPLETSGEEKSDGTVVLLRFCAPDGLLLVRILEYFGRYIPSLVIKKELWPVSADQPSSPLSKLSGMWSSFRKNRQTRHLKGTSTSQLSRVASTVTTGVSQRPRALQHFPSHEVVPVDVLKRRPALPPDQLQLIHQRLTNIYQQFAPEKAHTVPDLLLKYKGLEDLLLIKVVAKYGPSCSEPMEDFGGSPSLSCSDSLREHEYDSVCSEPNRTSAARGGSAIDIGRDSVHCPPPSSWHAGAFQQTLMSSVDEVDLLDNDTSEDGGVTTAERGGVGVDSSDDFTEDSVEDLMLEITVLERACDRMVWGAATSAASSNGTRSTKHMDEDAQQSRCSRAPGSVIDAVRQRAGSLAQCVTAICSASQKEANLGHEQALERQFLDLGCRKPRSASHVVTCSVDDPLTVKTRRDMLMNLL